MRTLFAVACTLLICANTHAQTLINQGFNTNPPADWYFGQGMQYTSYNNPINACASDVGYQTASVAPGNAKAFIVTAPVYYNTAAPNVLVKFKLFVFDANMQCNSFKPFACASYVKVYLVKPSYTSSAAPTPDVIFAEATPQLILANNVTQVTFPASQLSSLANGTQYRVYIDFNIASGCQQQNTKYILDDIIIEEKSAIILPVDFKDFTASRLRQNVELKWQTTTEAWNKGFHIQRKSSYGDWRTIDFVPSQAPQGNSSITLSYSYTDMNADKKISQYRIMQEDIDGRIKYSDIRFIRAEQQETDLVIFPNPSRDGKVNLVFGNENGLRDIMVVDANGRTVKNYRQYAENSLTIDRLTTGFYTIRVKNIETGTMTTEKLIIGKQ